MPTLPSSRPVRRLGAALIASLSTIDATPAIARTTGALDGGEPSPWMLAAVLAALCALAVWRWFRRLPDRVGQAGGWGATLRDVVLRNAVAAVVAWQLGAGVFRGVLARYGAGLEAGGVRIAMPIALAAATVGFLVARWLMVFAQRAWRRRRRIGG